MRLAVGLAAALLWAGAAAAADGAALYRRCAVCHLPTGAGVPGAFPPLADNIRALAASPAGRRYLVLAVTRGLAGPISVAGRSYRGVMPGQAALADIDVAALLNHLLTRGSGRPPPAFTIAEIGALRRGSGTLTPAAIARLRP